MNKSRALRVAVLLVDIAIAVYTKRRNKRKQNKPIHKDN